LQNQKRPNIALQRTPLARPLGWAQFLVVVACRQPCRFTRLPAAPLKAGVGPLIVAVLASTNQKAENTT